MELTITHDTNADFQTINDIEQSLRAHNFAVAGPCKTETFLLTAHDEEGKLQAGLKGLLGADWTFVEMLWVAEQYRYKGYGSKLLCQAEEKAKAYGCKGIFLDTHSYQAPEFYSKHGYKEFGRLENFPVGHARIWLSKKL